MSGDLMDPPVTALTAEVRRLLDQSAPVVAAHCERSYQFAAAFAATDGVELDDEVLYLGTVLHDIGLSPAADGDERFEVRGANFVRALLLGHGMEGDRVANIWDCIAMHASTPLARHKSAETRYTNRGIALDVRGSGGEALDAGLVRAVLDRWPRHDFPPSSRRCSPMRCALIQTRFACRGWNRSRPRTFPASCRPTSSPACATEGFA